jgi:hypothetical protein
MPISAKEELTADRLVTEITHRMACSVVDVQEKDEVDLGSTTYRIIAVRDPAGAGEFLSVDLEEIKPQ